MTDWISVENTPNPGRYLIIKDGQVRIAKYDGYRWIETLEFNTFEQTTHWAELPKPPEDA